jgi:hypothetical protein
VRYARVAKVASSIQVVGKRVYRRIQVEREKILQQDIG